ncbi:hypothetical protein MRX96_016753 [Rhipicephalus microplus]
MSPLLEHAELPAARQASQGAAVAIVVPPTPHTAHDAGTKEGEEGIFKIIAVSAVFITVGITILAIVVYSVLGSQRGNPGEHLQNFTADEMIFEDYPKGNMAPETPACHDMYGHVCTDKFIKSDVDKQPMRFQSLYLIITNIMKFINESVNKDIGYPRDSALVQTMLFVKNCTSQDDRLTVNNQTIFKSVFQKLGMQGFPFVDDTKQPLDVPTATLSYLYIFPFFPVSITHRKKENDSDDVAYVTAEQFETLNIPAVLTPPPHPAVAITFPTTTPEFVLRCA